MAWGATADPVDKQAYTVSIHYVEDTTGEKYDQINVSIPEAPDPNWINLLVANKIVDLTKRTSVVASIQPGYINPDSAILSAAQITASPAPK